MASGEPLNLLAVSHDLPPVLLPQAIQIGRLLSNSAHRIVAISGSEARSNALASSAGFDARVQQRVVPDDRCGNGLLQRLALRLVPFYGSVPDRSRGWIERACRAAAEEITSSPVTPDLVVTFGDPMSDHLVGLRLKRLFGLPWLAHFSDPWSDNPFRRRQPLSRPVNRWLERQVIEAADATVFTSEETIDLVFRRYSAEQRRRAHLLAHAFDPAAYPSEADDRGSTVSLRYIGNFYGQRTPAPLFRALAFLAKRDPSVLQGVQVDLVGSTPRRMLRSLALKSLPAGLVNVRGTVPYVESLRLMRQSDILLTIDAPAALSVFFPSKLADYIGSGRRLLGLVPPGAAARIITECGGRWVRPDASAELVAGLLRDEIALARAVRREGRFETTSPSNAGYRVSSVAANFDELCRRVADEAHKSGRPAVPAVLH